MSAATIDRRLAPERAKLISRGRSHTKPGTLLKSQIPIRTWADWDDAVPGFVEIDLIGHEGGNASGEHCFTLTVTDIATGWTVNRSVQNKAEKWVFDALMHVSRVFPFPIILGNGDEKGEREAAYLDLFEQQRMRGVLISPLGDITKRLRLLRERGIPAVLVDRAGGDSEFSSVSVDDIIGGELAADHLLTVGRRRLAFLGGPMSIQQVSDRLEGARRAVERQGASLEIVPTDALSVIAGRTAGLGIMAREPRDRPDAIFAANDLIAMGVLQALMMSGVSVRVPEEIALIGYDDIDFARAAVVPPSCRRRAAVVPLSSIRQPSLLIGETAVRILLEEAENADLAPRHVVFQPELVVRESTTGPDPHRYQAGI